MGYEPLHQHDANEDTASMREELEANDMLNAVVMELLSSSEEEKEEEENKWGGSRKGRTPNKERDFAEAYARLVKDYFNGSASVYNESDFERRFRMPRAQVQRLANVDLNTATTTRYSRPLTLSLPTYLPCCCCCCYNPCFVLL